MKKSIHLHWFFPQPPEIVWEYLTDPDLLKQWSNLNQTTPFEPRVGFSWTETAKPRPGWDGKMYFRVLEIDPGKKLVYSFRGGSSPEKLTLDTIVTWTLHAREGGTELHLDHTGFEGWRGAMTAFMMEKGWTSSFYKKLEKLLTTPC